MKNRFKVLAKYLASSFALFFFIYKPFKGLWVFIAFRLAGARTTTTTRHFEIAR